MGDLDLLDCVRISDVWQYLTMKKGSLLSAVCHFKEAVTARNIIGWFESFEYP
jgi:hypothetical protein